MPDLGASRFGGGTASARRADAPPRRLAWPELLQRVFAIDVLECPRCGGRMRLLTATQPPDVTQAILECLDLSSRAPPTAPAHPDPDDTEGWPGDLDPTNRGQNTIAQNAP